ncbi:MULTISPECIES: deoxyribodipyrimidine photo-lyase [unclassified Beijerinckia]|uniref:cryptochrome/photolyase family protein n=1 Tax=unclassified Beijerinckia TaxID=2638183 RepID=UPI00089D4CF1|nr:MULTISPECIES: deoxyribodipyrimidine photo-lyase [unclassified Beijerinckia]MDH7795276.1 deoxyribodipyrimidine photo-lyase [Beijerinckia sp. GAS462]SEB94824.1 deoxyribodipyrimidine photo-lyase type I [Beijerinckia sp. 28-YEA-48]
MSTAPVIVWLRNDLRLSDNPALAAAIATGAPLLVIYILETGVRARGGASRWWLHHSLDQLSKELSKRGGRLDILEGSAIALVPQLADRLAASHVFWNRRYDAAGIEIDKTLKAELLNAGTHAESFNGQLLNEPWTMTTKIGGPFKVFTPYWRACLAMPDPDAPQRAPAKIQAADWTSGAPARSKLSDLHLLPRKPDWAAGLRDAWTPGEASARQCLSTFLDEALPHYADQRDQPGKRSTSRLSAHLAFGEISPRQVWHAAHHAGQRSPALASNVAKFLSEIGWREFSYHLLFHNPDLARKNYNVRFDDFPWRTSAEDESAWRKGLTGYPIVDAGMRELWQTGFMHNRVRMIAASFLIKHLLLDWRLGEAWFWDTLVDADPANNAASWQWVAGSGADAAPYFRIFNPILQGEKFDPLGRYVRTYVPELANVPDAYLHKPWTAPTEILSKAGVELGVTYPRPIVDHAQARARALAAFKTLD